MVKKGEMNGKVALAFFLKLLMMLLLCLYSLGFSSKVEASETRYATIEEMTGTAYITRGEGLYEFIATKGTHLYEGDYLYTAEGASVVLSTHDRNDEITLSEHTAMHVASLRKEGEGHFTKLIVASGAAYIKVTKLQGKDEFKLVTPTNEFDVKGTNFVLTVSPTFGDTSVFVASGVVQATIPNRSSGIPPSGVESSAPVLIYPTQQISVYPDGSETPKPNVSIIDPEQFVQNAGPAVIEALIRNNAEAEKEREEFIKQLQAGESNPVTVPPTLIDLENQASLPLLEQNLKKLPEILVNSGIANGVISKQEIEEIIKESNQQVNQEIELGSKESLKLTPAQQAALEQQRKMEEQRKRQQQQAEQKRQQQQQNMTNVLNQIQQAMNELNRQNQQAQQQKSQDALDRYLESLTAQERERFEKDREKAIGNEKAPSPPPSGGDNSPSPSPSPVVITEINHIVETIEWNTEYTLPTTVTALMSNQTMREVNVTWDTNEIDTSVTGEFSFSGTVSGFSGEMSLTVFVEAPLGSMVPLQGEPVRFEGGIIVYQGENQSENQGDEESDDDPTVTVFEEEVEFSEETGLTVRSKIIRVETNREYPSPFTLKFPVTEGSNLERLGIYKLIPENEEWEYQYSTLDGTFIEAEIRPYNTFAVFEATTPTEPPANGPMGISFSPSEETGVIGGVVAVTRAENEEDIDSYAIYWGDKDGNKIGDPIEIISKFVDTLEYTIPEGTTISPEAISLIVVAQNSLGESEGYSSVRLTGGNGYTLGSPLPDLENFSQWDAFKLELTSVFIDADGSPVVPNESNDPLNPDADITLKIESDNENILRTFSDGGFHIERVEGEGIVNVTISIADDEGILIKHTFKVYVMNTQLILL
jgi:hypothetical protein